MTPRGEKYIVRSIIIICFVLPVTMLALDCERARLSPHERRIYQGLQWIERNGKQVSTIGEYEITVWHEYIGRERGVAVGKVTGPAGIRKTVSCNWAATPPFRGYAMSRVKKWCVRTALQGGGE